MKNQKYRNMQNRNFSAGPVIKTSSANGGGVGWIPGWGAKILHAVAKKKKQPQNPQHKTEAVCM